MDFGLFQIRILQFPTGVEWDALTAAHKTPEGEPPAPLPEFRTCLVIY